MESPIKFMRKYWNNPTAVLDALEISAWPPVDEADESSYGGHQHQSAQAAAHGDVPASVANNGTAYARSFTNEHHQPPRPTAARRPRPKAKPWLIPQEAAVRIQSGYRGHRARKGVRAMRRVRELETEVEAVEMRIMVSLDDLLRDGRERAKVNEMIMDVLLRLDGVGGDCREYRKMVTRKAISLQESLDCLVCEESREGERTDRRGDITQAKQLGEQNQDQSVTKLVKGEGNRAGDDGREQGSSNTRDDEVDEDEHDEEEGSRRSGCGGLREALGRVMEENAMLHGFVEDLLHRNEQQSQMMIKLSEEVEDLKRKLQSLGRKRRRSANGGGGERGPSSSSSSSSLFSSGEEGEHDDKKDCAREDVRDDDRRISGHHDRDDGRCER